METAKMLYSINNDVGVDVGTIIMAQILKTAASTRCLLTFPCLITHFCRSAGVYVAPDGADLVRPTGDLCARAYNQFCICHGLNPIPRQGRYRHRGRHAYAPEQEEEEEEEEEAQPQAQIPPEPPARRGRQPRQGNVRPNPPAWATPIIEDIHEIRAKQAAQRSMMDGMRAAQHRTTQIAEDLQYNIDRRFFNNNYQRRERNYVQRSSSRQPPTDGN